MDIIDDVIDALTNSETGHQPKGYAYEFDQLCKLIQKLSIPSQNAFCNINSTTSGKISNLIKIFQYYSKFSV